MPPKKEKSAKSAKKPQSDSKEWETELLAAQIEEEQWKPAIYFAVGEKLENEMFLAALSGAIEVPLRKLFSIISWEGTMKQISEFGDPKNQKSDDLPMFYEITQAAWTLLAKGEELPLPLISKLVKFQILCIKRKDLQKKEIENKTTEEEETTVSASAGKKKTDKKSPGKGKGKVERKSPEPPVAKKTTKLLKRGEVEVIDRCINDEPDDGPQRYIIIQGFQNLQFILMLGEFGINISAVIRISYERNKNLRLKPDTAESEIQPSQTPEANEAERQQKAAAIKSLELFWKYLDPVLNSGKPGSKLFDVARLQYTVKESMLPEEWNDDTKLELGEAIFEDIATMIYDCEDWKRQYQNYLHNIKLITIPEASKGEEMLALETPGGRKKLSSANSAPHAKQDSSTLGVDMRYYNDLMSLVPLESLSVPLILHCILEQVVAKHDSLTPPSELVPKPRKDGLDQSLVDHLISTVLSLSMCEDEKQKFVEELKDPQHVPKNEHSTDPSFNNVERKQDAVPKEDKPLLGEEGPEPQENMQLPAHEEEEQKVIEEMNKYEQKRPHEKFKQPLLLNLHDTMTQRTYHLKVIHGFDPATVEQEMMKKLPVAKFLNFTSPLPEIDDKRLASIQDLMYYCTSEMVINSEVERTFKQFLFESMTLTKVDENGELEEKEDVSEEKLESTCIPWDDPVRFAKKVKEIATVKKMDTQNNHAVDSFTKVSEEAETCPLKFNRPREYNRPCKKPCSSEQLVDASEMVEKENRRESLTEKDKADTLKIDIKEIQKLQLRSLMEWCYAEQHDPIILIQVLQEAVPFYRCLDTYYHRQDNSTLLVLHNPMNKQCQCKQSWKTALHSDVGFRNYLEYVAHLISDWVKEEEAKYQEELAVKELEAQKLQVSVPEASAEPLTISEKTKKGKAASGSKIQTNTSRPQSKPETVVEEEDKEKSNEPFMREGSLKAWKKDQEKLKEEEQKKIEKKGKKERPESKKKEAKVQSVGSKAPKSATKSAKQDNKTIKEQETTPVTVPEIQQPSKPKEEFYKFTGYNFGNDLIQVSGEVNSLFPADGGHIQVKIMNFLHGSTVIQVCVMKDRHNFFTYITDPIKNLDENEVVPTEKTLSENFKEEEKRTKLPVSKFGSFSAVLDDGIILTLSKDIPEKHQKKVEEDPVLAEILNIPPVHDPTPAPVITPPSTAKPDKSPKNKTIPSGKGKHKKETISSAPVEEPQQPKEEPEVEIEQPLLVPAPTPENVPEPPVFLRLNACSPDGLLITFFTEHSIGIETEDGHKERILLRQSYPIKTKGSQPCEAARKWPAMQEASRVITFQGTVVKYMMNGSTEILFADGTVSRSPDSGPVSIPQPSTVTVDQPDPEGQESKDEKEIKRVPSEEASKKGKHGHLEQSVPRANEQLPPIDPLPGTWITTTPIGLVIGTKGMEKWDIKPILVYKATDPGTGEIMITRQDKVVTVFGSDNTIVEHADGTRITTFFQDISIADYELQDETEVIPEKVTRYVKCIKVECVGFATVLMNWNDCTCCALFGNDTTIIAKPQGMYQVFPASSGSLLIDQDGCAVYTSGTNNEVVTHSTIRHMELQPGAYFMKYNSLIICEVMDPEGNYFQVMLDGNIFSTIHNDIQEKEDVLFQDQMIKHEPITYNKHAPRLFILHADGSGTELLRSSDGEEYIDRACSNSATAVLKEQLPEYPGVLGITFLKPSTKDIGSRWLIEKDMVNIIPPNLQSRKWDTFPQREVPGPPIGMQLCDQQTQQADAPSPAVLKCPSVLEVHQLFQYEPINIEMQLKMQTCLKEYIEHILQKEQLQNEMMLKEPRNEEEVAHAADLLKLVLSFPDDELCQMEEKEANKVDVASIYEEAVASTFNNIFERHTCEWTEVDKESSKRQKHASRWPQRIEQYRQELEVEKASRLALENMIVPPYFLSDLDKAFDTSQPCHKDYLPSQTMKVPDSSIYLDSDMGVMNRPTYPTSADDAETGTCSLKRRDSPTQEAVDSQYQYFTAEVINSPAYPASAHVIAPDTCSLKRRESPTQQAVVTSQHQYPTPEVINSPAYPASAHVIAPDTCSLKRRESPTQQAVTSQHQYPTSDVTNSPTYPTPAHQIDSDTCPLKRKGSSSPQAVTSRYQYPNPDAVNSSTDPIPANGMQLGTCSLKRRDHSAQQAMNSQYLYSKPVISNNPIHPTPDQAERRGTYPKRSNSPTQQVVFSECQCSMPEVNNNQRHSTPAHHSDIDTCSLKRSGSPTQKEVFSQRLYSKPDARHKLLIPTHATEARIDCPMNIDFQEPQAITPQCHLSRTNFILQRTDEQDLISQKPNNCCSLHKPLSIPVNDLKDIGAINGMVEYKPEELPGDGSNIIFHKSLVINAASQLRKEKVKLPSAILSSKPFSLPNQRFAVIEEPVRRKVNTVSVAGAVAGGLLKEPTRGFELFPREVNFGILQEGFTYAYTVSLKNVGIDSCRFRVKQPPPSTGLRVCFKPGPVAAGLKTDLDIELYAMAIGLENTEGAGYLCHHLNIQTEAEELFLPITATVLTECVSKTRPEELPKGGKAAGVRLICTDPTFRMDTIRPRKALATDPVGNCVPCEI